MNRGIKGIIKQKAREMFRADYSENEKEEHDILLRCSQGDESGYQAFSAVSLFNSVDIVIRKTLEEHYPDVDDELHKNLVNICIGKIYSDPDFFIYSNSTTREAIKKYAFAATMKYIKMANNK